MVEKEGLTIPEKRVGELRECVAEFLEAYDVRKHVEETRASQEQGRANFDKVLQHGKMDEEGQRLVFSGLMPHGNTPFVREEGRWISIAPSVTREIRVWFEGAKWVQPHQWPDVGIAIVDFLQTALDGDLEAACQRFSEIPVWGFQGGIVSPILNALDPGRFSIVNKKPVDALNHFAGAGAHTGIHEYPRVNRQVFAFCGIVAEMAAGHSAVEGLTPWEIGDTFCHWVVSVKKQTQTKKKLRFFKIAPGREANLWEECRTGGCIAVAWDDLGDVGGLSRDEFNARMDLVRQSDPSITKQAMWQVWTMSRLKKGEHVLANRGTTAVLGFGEVVGDYYYDDDAETHKHRVPIRWFDTQPRRVNQGGWRKTVIRLSEEDWEQLLAAPKLPPKPDPKPSPPDPERVTDAAPSIATNLILYGPPGTGKTYATARRAVELCLDPETTLERAVVVEELRQLSADGFVEFVTFHQSYGYEEFVEGIRPVMDGQSGELTYKVEDGLFKRVALRAAAEGVVDETSELPFDSLWSQLLDEIEAAASGSEEAHATAANGNTYALSLTSQGNIRGHRVDTEDDGKPVVTEAYMTALKVYAEALWRRRDDLGTEPGDYSYGLMTRIIAEEMGTQGGHHGALHWLVHLRLRDLAALHQNLPREFGPSERRKVLNEILRTGKTSSLSYDGAKQYVLVIDEINRGNMSKILGELITLLEPSKRLTQCDQLVVQLPYSKSKFAVPPNLHVVGTMNTADRSIALMDVALRRRFEFEEMMPDVAVLVDALQRDVAESVHGGKEDYVNLVAALFECINARIRFLYDEDHQLGHSMLMTATSYLELRKAVVTTVIPMLQEYFYGSWDRVCSALGCPYVDGAPARKELVHEGAYRAPFIEAVPVSERDLLGFDHVSYEDQMEYRLSSGLGGAQSAETPRRVRQMCIDALSGEHAKRFEARAYTR